MNQYTNKICTTTELAERNKGVRKSGNKAKRSLTQ